MSSPVLWMPGSPAKTGSWENGADVEPIIDLVYSKASFQPTRWVLAIPQESPIQDIGDLNGKKIATELVRYTKRYFDERGIGLRSNFPGEQPRPRPPTAWLTPLLK